MKIICIHVALAIALLLPFTALAETPQCGVFEDNSGNIRVVGSGPSFSVSKLMADGAFSGRGPGFGCWVSISKDPKVRSSMMYSYTVTTPGGEIWPAGPYGIQEGGFGSGTFNASGDKSVGVWKVEYFMVSRENGAKSPIGSTTFTMTK